ncbi:hypothetical protein AMS68_007210 [Peltaster fructicola]|uniref:FAD-binding PCMH-type domain-containing protein n=1 Tax=Peltaster fructicola TaxID=286661 RepID=A0A6H0Y3W6_9PEZI|nr:hypothetical protein AMS68_007210 [Peltaster fructicola]
MESRAARKEDRSEGMAIINKWSGALFSAAIAYILAVILPQHLSLRNDRTAAVDVAKFDATGQIEACVLLARALPGIVYSEQHPSFDKFLSTYWALNAAELRPACIVRPTDTNDVAAAVRTLRLGWAAGVDVKFAVRSGGHSPEAGFAGIANGVVIDMSLINEVSVSADRTSTTIGVGARWREVYSTLDRQGLAMVGGRNANVGVGGLILGGGVSFFSPRFGMVCDNIDKYEIVLANGSIVVATAHQHADLWRALKGGTGNLGIVTRATTKAFPSGDLWAGYVYWANWQMPKVLRAFHEFNKPENFDNYAGGPILALAYVGDLGIRVIACSLSYTKPEKWPAVFDGFKSIWRLWSTIKVQSLTAVTEELDGLALSGQRQFQVTTTIKNDLETFEALNRIYTDTLPRTKTVKGSTWSLVFQPLSAAVTRKGSPNVLGLETREANDTLVIVLICAVWERAEDDELVYQISRDVIRQSEEYAREKGTSDPFIYLNYAASGQDVLSGYGDANRAFLDEVRTAYDPEAFFQLVKQGGFKLGVH